MYSQSCGSLYIFEGTFISNTHNHMQQYLISKLPLSPRSCRYLIVIFYVQKSQRRGQRAWKLTDRHLPQPSPFLQRISSAQSHLWPTQASLRGVSTVRTQHCGATCLPQSVLFLPPPPNPSLLPSPDLWSEAPMPQGPSSGPFKTNDQPDLCCFLMLVGRFRCTYAVIMNHIINNNNDFKKANCSFCSSCG